LAAVCTAISVLPLAVATMPLRLDVLVVAGERDRRHLAGATVARQRHLVDGGPLRVGEVDAALRRDRVVDEGGSGTRRELEFPNQAAGARVVDAGVPEAGAGDPEQTAVVLDAGRRANTRGARHERPSFAGTQVDDANGPVGDGPDVGGVALDLKSLGREAVRERDLLGIRPLGERGRSRQRQQEDRQQESSHGFPLGRFPFLTATRAVRISARSHGHDS
jgi:hypothetical protein